MFKRDVTHITAYLHRYYLERSSREWSHCCTLFVAASQTGMHRLHLSLSCNATKHFNLAQLTVRFTQIKELPNCTHFPSPGKCCIMSETQLFNGSAGGLRLSGRETSVAAPLYNLTGGSAPIVIQRKRSKWDVLVYSSGCCRRLLFSVVSRHLGGERHA